VCVWGGGLDMYMYMYIYIRLCIYIHSCVFGCVCVCFELSLTHIDAAKGIHMFVCMHVYNDSMQHISSNTSQQ
jgi:hypothetical protein